MDQMLEVLSLFLSVENILMIAVGVVIGVVIGAIPGLTATMAVALALPFTFGMEPVTAILLLVKLVVGLRVNEEAERTGLDVTSHGESAYEA